MYYERYDVRPDGYELRVAEVEHLGDGRVVVSGERGRPFEGVFYVDAVVNDKEPCGSGRRCAEAAFLGLPLSSLTYKTACEATVILWGYDGSAAHDSQLQIGNVLMWERRSQVR